jgi:hypothetical protein
VICPRPFEYKDVAYTPFDVNGYHIVWLFHLLKLRVHQGFIKIKDKSLFTTAMIRLSPQKALVSSESWLSANK